MKLHLRLLLSHSDFWSLVAVQTLDVPSLCQFVRITDLNRHKNPLMRTYAPPSYLKDTFTLVR